MLNLVSMGKVKYTKFYYLEHLKIVNDFMLAKGVTIDDIVLRTKFKKSNLERLFAGLYVPNAAVYLQVLTVISAVASLNDCLKNEK